MKGKATRGKAKGRKSIGDKKQRIWKLRGIATGRKIKEMIT